jgi:membrane glycosyltransferase
LWLAPIIAGLAASPWLISLSSSENLGRRAGLAGFFKVPDPGIDEALPPPQPALPEAPTFVEA